MSFSFLKLNFTTPYMTNSLHQNIQFVYYTPAMYSAFQNLMKICFHDMGGEYASEEEMQLLHDLYPKGQIMAYDGTALIGAVISRIVPYESYNKAHTQAQILDLTTYVADAAVGNALYGLDIFVHPDYRAFKLGNTLYGKLLDEFSADNFTDFLGASLVSNYGKYAPQMSLEEYVENVKNRTIKDGALSFHLYNGMVIFDVMHDFNPSDLASLGCGVAMGHKNPNYNPNLPIYTERAMRLKKFLVHE